MIINNPKCDFCGEEMEISERDVLQIYEEMLESLNCKCEKCGNENNVTIKESVVTLKAKRLMVNLVILRF